MTGPQPPYGSPQEEDREPSPEPGDAGWFGKDRQGGPGLDDRDETVRTSAAHGPPDQGRHARPAYPGAGRPGAAADVPPSAEGPDATQVISSALEQPAPFQPARPAEAMPESDSTDDATQVVRTSSPLSNHRDDQDQADPFGPDATQVVSPGSMPPPSRSGPSTPGGTRAGAGGFPAPSGPPPPGPPPPGPPPSGPPPPGPPPPGFPQPGRGGPGGGPPGWQGEQFHGQPGPFGGGPEDSQPRLYGAPVQPPQGPPPGYGAPPPGQNPPWSGAQPEHQMGTPPQQGWGGQPPPAQQWGAQPQYGAPQQQQYGMPQQQYGMPQQQQYGIPQQQYGAPQQQYGAQQYGAQQYGAPPQQYGAPQPPWGGQPYGHRPAYAGQGQPAVNPERLAVWSQRAIGGLIDIIGPGIVVGISFLIAIFTGDKSLVVLSLVLLLGALGFAFYNAYKGGATGQSIGKKYAKIRLVKEGTGDVIGGGNGILRCLLHVLDVLPAGLGFLAPLFTQKKQTFADMIVATVVVKAG